MILIIVSENMEEDNNALEELQLKTAEFVIGFREECRVSDRAREYLVRQLTQLLHFYSDKLNVSNKIYWQC